MGFANSSFQFSSTILCEHYRWQKHDLRRTSKPKASGGTDNRLLGKLSYASASWTAPPLPCRRGYSNIIAAGSHSEPNVVTGTVNGPFSVTHDATTECPKHEPHKAIDPPNSAPNVCMSPDIPDEAITRADVVVTDKDGRNSSSFPSCALEYAEQPECPLSGATSDVSSSPNRSNGTILPSTHEHDDADDNDTGCSHDASTSYDAEGKGKIRRFSLTERGLLKTLQESKVFTPLEKINLEKIMKFKVTNDNLKGRLVIRAVRIEQMKDLENLLTDSYSELMWGPLTYRPVLAWILSTYLRERQAYLPNAVTLVGLYNPSEETMIQEESSPKWWLVGAVEISFNATGKPKDMQAPLPPEDAPFLSNMAVLKKFRRRGIGRELLKAAEQLAIQMGSNEMYLHCRMSDEAPLNMYKSSGYLVVETDSILSLLLFQRRRHLMYKRLVEPVNEDE